jgi:RNA polymerase sigma-70 factor (ECF subfamily)
MSAMPARRVVQWVPLASERGMEEARTVAPGETADQALLYRLARGERAALAVLYERHAAMMLALAQRILRDAREAEDLVHDVFVEAWRHAGDYDPTRASVRSWLLLRVRSRCLDRARSAGVRRVSLMPSPRELPREDAEAHAADHGRVRAALDALSSEQRRVLELGYFHGLSSQEIADYLGIPIGTVKSRVSAAMVQLRRALGAAPSGEARS